ncbi:hypothetical protein AT984_16915 [Paucibacter sp. KCTC 42545]|nr:hypothetical protein AT984_16915 [Paucibacter sp. KCTC 42545]
MHLTCHRAIFGRVRRAQAGLLALKWAYFSGSGRCLCAKALAFGRRALAKEGRKGGVGAAIKRAGTNLQ